MSRHQEENYLREQYINRYQEAGIEAGIESQHNRPELTPYLENTIAKVDREQQSPLLHVYFGVFLKTIKGSK